MDNFGEIIYNNFLEWYKELPESQLTEWGFTSLELQSRYSKVAAELQHGSYCIEKAVEDVVFFEIYHKAFQRLLDLQDSNYTSQIRRYLVLFDDFADDWCQFVKTNISRYDNLVDSLMDSLYYRFLYIYRNGLLLSSAVALHFGGLLQENSEITRKLLQKKTLKVCSIGGGCASDIVAIVKVLESIAQKKGKDLDIRVTIVDSDGRWKNACFVVLNCLRQFYKANWKVSFIEADISEENMNRSVAWSIRDADIVTMAKFFSEFRRGHYDLEETLQNVTGVLSSGSMLYVLDEADFVDTCGGYTGVVDTLQLLYEEICYLHTLDLAAVEKVILTYQKYLASLQCNTSQSLFVRIWLKTTDSDMSWLKSRDKVNTTSGSKSSLQVHKIHKLKSGFEEKVEMKVGLETNKISGLKSGSEEKNTTEMNRISGSKSGMEEKKTTEMNRISGSKSGSEEKNTTETNKISVSKLGSEEKNTTETNRKPGPKSNLEVNKTSGKKSELEINKKSAIMPGYEENVSESHLRHRFQRNFDQYNLKETFVDETFFRNWNRDFAKEMKQKGWSRLGTIKVALQRKSVADGCLFLLTELKTCLDLAIEKLECVVDKNGKRKITGMFTEDNREFEPSPKYEKLC